MGKANHRAGFAVPRSGSRGLGVRLRAARRSAGLTQAEAAYYVGVRPGARAVWLEQSFVSKCERGERRVRRDELDAFAAVYGCSTDALLCEPTVEEDSTLVQGRRRRRSPAASRVRRDHIIPTRGADGRWTRSTHSDAD
jgi:transcriptional regulator with XRE-family HTH domain